MKKWKVGILFFVLVFALGTPVTAKAATSEQEEACKQIILELLYSANTEIQNISKYRMTESEFLEVCSEIRYGEGAEIFGGYYPSAKFTYTTGFFGYIQTVQLKDVNEDALTRYEQMVPIIDEIIEGIEDDMSDVDKLIYLHDVIVDTVTYKVSTDAMFIASGALVDKQAVCAGYAKALNVLLHRVGIETTYVSGTSLNHGWSYVKLDGEWYHADPTWDDTRTPITGEISRTNLLRNDSEFSKNHGVWEVRVIDETSDSEQYGDWVVHDIVGDMLFEDGLWYWLDKQNKEIVAIDAVNNYKETLFSFSGMGSVALVDVLEDQIILSVNGEEISQTVEQWKLASEEEKEDIQMSPAGEAVYAMDFSDFSLWRTGYYDSYTGTYCLNRARVCLTDLIENLQEQYVITIGNEEYKVAIREYNERKRIIGSVELGDGEVYVPSEGTIYLGVSIFNSVQSKGLSFEHYESMFEEGLVVGFNLYVEETESENDTEQESEDEAGYAMDFSDISFWRTGYYDSYTGTYCLNRARVCLTDLIENLQEQYVITIGNEEYKVAIREYNERKRIIGSVELGDGEVYVPSEGTIYLGVSIFNSVQSKGLSYEHYESMFEEGFIIGFNLMN